MNSNPFDVQYEMTNLERMNWESRMRNRAIDERVRLLEAERAARAQSFKDAMEFAKSLRG
jgi:hypothetical protein